MKSSQPFGVCRLTGDKGAYVKSHLIPLALTRLETRGAKFIEAGIGHGVKTRSNSWYDEGLVTRKGEDILADIDGVGIQILREHRLVWSAWGAKSLKEEGLPDLEVSGAIRTVAFQDPRALQLFFLSLLWRAGASSRPEFNDVMLSESTLADLAGRIARRDPGSFLDYPVQLFQLSTKGPLHNRTPILERKAMLGIDLLEGSDIEYVRFYFDGLVAHINLAVGVELTEGYANSFLNEAGATYVFQNDYDGSRTARDMLEMASTVYREERTPPVARTLIADALMLAWEQVRSERRSRAEQRIAIASQDPKP